jgi:hypothetical protein
VDWSWLDSALGAVIGIAAFAAGRAGSRARRSQLALEPPAVCGCGHHYAMHDDDQVCHGTQRVLVETGANGRKYETDACGCKRYSGPEPLPRYVSGD